MEVRIKAKAKDKKGYYFTLNGEKIYCKKDYIIHVPFLESYTKEQIEKKFNKDELAFFEFVE